MDHKGMCNSILFFPSLELCWDGAIIGTFHPNCLKGRRGKRKSFFCFLLLFSNILDSESHAIKFN